MYAVRKGTIPGVYNTWEECKEQVNGFKGAIYCKVSSMEEGLRFIETGKKDGAEGVCYAFRNAGLIFDTWEECQKAVSGYKGAEFRKFKNREEAEAWLDGDIDVSTETQYDFSLPTFFVDGSGGNGSVGAGFILVENNNIKTGGGRLVNCENHVLGELAAVVMSLKVASKMHYDSIQICYDYEGIEKWCNGAWTCKKEYAAEYRDFVQNSGVHITFTKVEAHSKDRYNDMADKTAKRMRDSGNYYQWSYLIHGETEMAI